VARGLTRTGVTIMQMDEGLDTGDVRLQRACDIRPDETGESLLDRLGPLGAAALAEALALLKQGALPRTPQDHARVTLAPLLTREDGRMNFGRSAFELDQRRRGFTPWPAAWTTREGSVIKIHAAVPVVRGEPGAPEGGVLTAGPAGIEVACGSGTALRVLELQPEGKKRMPAGAYLAGHPLRPGERLGT
jgi:methionyl-tRNA formyltransferase